MATGLTSREEQFKALHQRLPVSLHESGRWDKEWIHYLNYHDPKAYVFDCSRFELEPEELAHFSELSAFEMLEKSMGYPRMKKTLPPLKVWAKGSDVVGKRVLEIGCGVGYLGKQLGSVADVYLGIDYSPFALSLARLVSPPACTYIHLSEQDAFLPYLNTMETLVGRDFFIHQNFENARWLLQLASALLMEGGVMIADFFYNEAPFRPGVYPCRSPLVGALSSGFVFTLEDVCELVGDIGFQVEESYTDSHLQRLFVRLVKTRAQKP